MLIINPINGNRLRYIFIFFLAVYLVFLHSFIYLQWKIFGRKNEFFLILILRVIFSIKYQKWIQNLKIFKSCKSIRRFLYIFNITSLKRLDMPAIFFFFCKINVMRYIKSVINHYLFFVVLILVRIIHTRKISIGTTYAL